MSLVEGGFCGFEVVCFEEGVGGERGRGLGFVGVVMGTPGLMMRGGEMGRFCLKE